MRKLEMTTEDLKEWQITLRLMAASGKNSHSGNTIRLFWLPYRNLWEIEESHGGLVLKAGDTYGNREAAFIAFHHSVSR